MALSYKVVENNDAVNKSAVAVMEVPKEAYENSKYGLISLTPLLKPLKWTDLESLNVSIQKEQDLFESMAFFRLWDNIAVASSSRFAFLNNINHSNSHLIPESCFELDLNSVITFPSKSFSSSPCAYIKDIGLLKLLESDFLSFCLSRSNSWEAEFIRWISASGPQILANLLSTQDEIFSSLVEVYKNLFLHTRNHFNRVRWVFRESKHIAALRAINTNSIIISFNPNYGLLIEDWHHKLKAIQMLIQEGKLDIWIFDDLSIKFMTTKVSPWWPLDDIKFTHNLSYEVLDTLKEENPAVYALISQ